MSDMARLAARAEKLDTFIASALRAARETHGWDDAQLAAVLGMEPDNLPRLALCRRPTDIGERHEGRLSVLQIAEYAGCNPEALAGILLSA